MNGETGTTLRVGVARADITPPVGIAHDNWGAAVHSRAEGIDLPMWATVLAVQDDSSDTTTIIVDLDLLHLPLGRAKEMRETISRMTGVPVANVRASVTHTHSGPSQNPHSWVREGADLVEGYVASLAGKVTGAAWEAMQCLQPARLAAGTGQSFIGINRRQRDPDGRVVVGRNPEGFFDPTVGVLRFDDVQGRPLAAVVHYATHPTMMAYENRLITPDYPGMVRRTVEQVTGATCLFLQGCAGNIGPRLGFTEQHTGDTSFYRRAGATLGAEVARVFLGLDTQPYDAQYVGVLESGAPLGVYRHVPREADAEAGTVRVATAQVTLPVRPFPSREEGETQAREARETLASLRQQGASEDEIRNATWRAKRLAQQAGHSRLSDGQPEVSLELQAIQIGPAALVGAPMEVFGELGAAVAEQSPFAWTAVSGYTNGSAGYLPTAAAFDEGGYEVEMASPFARQAGERFVAAATSLLQQLKG